MAEEEGAVSQEPGEPEGTSPPLGVNDSAKRGPRPTDGWPSSPPDGHVPGFGWGEAKPAPHLSLGPPPPAPGGAPLTAGAQDGYGFPYGPQGHGHPVPGWGGPPLPIGRATASLVLGVVGVLLAVTCWGGVLSLLVSPLAIGLGVSARRGGDRGEQGERGLATAGFALGVIGSVLALLAVVVIVLWFLTSFPTR